jgi:hypothetical protein
MNNEATARKFFGEIGEIGEIRARPLKFSPGNKRWCYREIRRPEASNRLAPLANRFSKLRKIWADSYISCQSGFERRQVPQLQIYLD